MALQLQYLCSPFMKTEEDVVAELGKLPKELFDIYENIYKQITGVDSKNRAQRAFKFLVCGQKPIHTAAFLSAICPEDSKPVDAKGLLNICCNLIVQDNELDIFRFSHLSVREYLERRVEYSQIEANTTVAEICLSHLLKRKDFEGDGERTWEWNMVFSLDDYATFYWPLHCQLSGENRKGELKSKLKSFLPQRKVGTAFSAWMEAARAATNTESRDFTTEDKLRSSLCSPPKPFYLACAFNLLELVERDSSSMKEWNEAGLTGLHIACLYGHDEIVRLLLDRGAESTKMDAYARTPLSYAAQSGHVKIVEMLLDHDENIKVTEELSYAVQSGHVKIVEMLLDHDENIKVTEELIIDAFGDRDCTKMLELLLDRNDTLVISEQILGASVRQNSTKNLEFLCDQDREVQITNGVVLEAVSYCNAKAIEVLLRENRELVIDEQSLIRAAECNYHYDPVADECLSRLLARYPDARVPESVLEAAVLNRTGAVKILLARDPELQVSERLFKQAVSALDCDAAECLLTRYSNSRISAAILVAAAQNETCGGQLVKYLLSRNSDAGVSEEILLAGAQNQNCGEEVVESVLSRDSNLPISETVIEAAAGNSSFGTGLAVTKLLLSRGGEQKHVDAAMRGVLASGNQELLEYLLDRNKQIQVTEELVIQSIELNHYSSICDVLLNRNRDIQVSEEILMAAAKAGNLEVVERLLAHGGSANISKEVIISAMETDIWTADFLLNQAVGMQVDDDFIIAAITCQYYSSDFLDALIKQSPNKITEAIVIAAAKNTDNGFGADIFAHLLDQWGTLPITEQVWTAASRVNNGVLKLLLSRGEKPPAADVLLEPAATSGQMDVVQLLLDHTGATDPSSSKWPAIAQLFNAAYTGDDQTMQTLLASGVDPAAVSAENGWTPLIAAASGGYVEVVKLLIGDARVKIEAVDEEGKTALFVAAENGCVDVVRALLEKGASASVRDEDGESPLEVAVENGYEGVVEVLKMYEKA